MTAVDEVWLADALQDLGAGIEVPGEGPARVLAAREQIAPRRPATRRAFPASAAPAAGGTRRAGTGSTRPWVKAAAGVALGSFAVLILGLVMAGNHGSSGSSSTTSLQNGVAPGFAPAAPSQSQTGPAGGTPATPPPGVATKIIKTGSVDLQVGRGRLSPTVDQLTSLAGGLGGYVSDAKTIEGGGAPSGDLTLRVPVGQFETLLSRVRAMGKPTSVTTSGQDITAAYVDLDARIQALQDSRTQYLQILAKTAAIGDILSVEQQLSALQTQIEQLQGQQKVLADQTAFGTLAVHLGEPGSSPGPTPTAPSGLSKAWDHARHTFASGAEAVIGASGGVLVFLLCLGAVLLTLRLSWPLIRRRLV